MFDSLGFARNRCYSSKIAPEDLRNQMFAREGPRFGSDRRGETSGCAGGEETRFPRST